MFSQAKLRGWGMQDQPPTLSLQTQHQTHGTHPSPTQGCADFHMWDEKMRKNISRGHQEHPSTI